MMYSTINDLVATEVMGWHLNGDIWVDKEGYPVAVRRRWQPTINFSDVKYILAKFEKLDLIKREHGWICWIHDGDKSVCSDDPMTFGMSVCIAALKCKGIDVEGLLDG